MQPRSALFSTLVHIILITVSYSYSVLPPAQPSSSRKAFIAKTMSASLALLGTTPAFPALADEPDELIDCYFGMGCFWHIQHVSTQIFPDIPPLLSCRQLSVHEIISR
jgi:hypothetical protein